MSTLADLHDVLHLHAAFWRRGEVDRPLIGTTRWSYFPLADLDYGLPFDEGVLEPEMLAVDHFLPQYEAYYEVQGVLDGDLLWWAAPLSSLPWMEAIAGCPVRYSQSSGSMFTEPTVGDSRQLPEQTSLADNPWLKKLVEFTEGLVGLSAGRFPVSPPIMRGPWDMAGALRGMTNLYVDLYDHPVEVKKLAVHCARLWMAVGQRLAEVIPPWHGGYAGFLGMWGPRFILTPQNDHAISVSARTYRELMLPADRLTVQACPLGVFHMHSAGFQHIDTVVGILEGHALQISLDPTGPSVKALLPAFGRVQEQGTPLLLVANTLEQVQELANNLSLRGLAIYHIPAEDARSSAEVPDDPPREDSGDP